MNIDQTNTAAAPGAEMGKSPRRENLALLYQEILTVTTRLRTSRHAVMGAETFRGSMKAALSAAEAEAVRRGYTPDDARLASFAVAAFLDDSVESVKDPNFAKWSRRPLQEELRGERNSGDTFFQCIDRLLERGGSPQDADVLEVFGLCLLLGYQSRDAAGGQVGVQAAVTAIMDRVQTIRGPRPLAPDWAPSPDGMLRPPHDPWVLALLLGALGALFLTVLFFIGYKAALLSGTSGLHSIGVLAPH